MKKILTFCFLMALVCAKSRGQSVLISPTGDGGFETGTTFALNNWNVVNGSNNTWVLGNSAGVQGGSRAAYIGTASSWASTNNTTDNHFYRDVVIPAGATAINLSFYLQWPTVDDGYDYLNVYTTTTSRTPVAGTLPGTGYAQIFSQTSTALTSYTLETISLPSSLAGTTVRLVFTYVNDGGNPKGKAAIDNISLTYTPFVACTTPAKPNGASVSSNSATSFSGTITPPSPVPTGYLVVTSTSPSLSSQPANSTTYNQGDNIGGGKVQYVGTTTSYTTSQTLASNTNYYVFVYSYNSGCSGAPYYSSASTNTSIATCPGQVTGLTASSVVYNGFTLGWTAPAGNATLSYTIDVSANSNFSTHATGYPATQTATTKVVTGLSGNTIYYYSVTASNTNSGCTNAAVTGTVTTPLPPCSGAPTAGTASAGTSSFCTSGSTTLTLSGYTSNATGIGLQWYKSTDNVNFAAISGATGATLSTGTITATTYYYCKVSCSGSGQSVNSNVVTESVSYPPAISTQPVAQQVCVGSPFTLTVTATNATGYQWKKDGINISGATNATYAVAASTASDAGNYTVTVSANSPCTGITSGIATVTVSTLPTTLTVTPSSVTICSGNVQQLTANGGFQATSLSTENFNSATNNWTKINNSTGFLSDINAAAWKLRPNAYLYTDFLGFDYVFHSNDNSQFYLSNSDEQGPAFFTTAVTNTTLTSPVLNTTGYQSLSLNFYQNFLTGFNSNDVAAVQVSTDGTNFTTVTSYTTDQGAETYNSGTDAFDVSFVSATVNLNAYINKPTLYIRFKYTSNFGFWWAIDNVSLTGSAQGAVTWLPITNLYTNAAATTAYTTNTPAATVYAKPVASTTYTATVTNISGCTATASSALTVNQKSSNPTSASASSVSICIGQSTTLTLNGGGGGTGAVIKWYSGSCGGTLAGSGNNLSVSPTANTTYYGRYEDGAPCNNNTSCAQVAITVSPVSVGGSVSGNAIVCSGSNSGTLSLSGYTGSIVRWESSVNGGTTWTNIANTTASQPYTNLTQTTQYRALIQSGACSSAYSMIVTITVKTSPTASISPLSGSACEGQSVAVDITGTAGASITYNVNSGTAQTMTLPVSTINSPSNTGNYVYTLTSVTLNGCTGTLTNNSATIAIHALPDAAISGKDFVQIGNQITLTGASSGGNWSSSNTGAATVTNSTGVVTGSSSGTSVITYAIPSSANQYGCSNSATKPVSITADYVTRNNGNFSNINTWKRGTVNGFVNATVIPAIVNTIEVQHDLILDQDFQVGANKSFVMSAAGTMTIQPGKVFSSSGIVNFGHKAVTVKSDANGTGAIGQMTTAIANADNVTIERYIGSSSFQNGRRSWRLVTSPITDKTIHQTWQEDAASTSSDPNPTYGTLITGEGLTKAVAESLGFDYIGGGNHTSIKQYVTSTTGGNWTLLSGNGTSGTNIPVSSQPAWMLFVRGDRTANTPSSKGIATLRATGTLNQAAAAITVNHTQPYTLAGNPYAAPVNFDNIYNSSISNTFVVWNSQQGDYGAYNFITKEGDGSYTVVPFSNAGNTNNTAKYIQSGSGFFVSPSSSTTDGSITIGETAKNVSATGGISTFREVAHAVKKLWVNLNLKSSDTSATVADGVLARFDDAYSAGIDADDALKQVNFNENLGIRNGLSNLSIEARPDVQETDTVQLRLWYVSKRDYLFQIKADNFGSAAGLHAYLEDNYLATKQEVSLQGDIATINFTVNSDSGSWKSDRFRIVFHNDAVVLPVTLINVKAVLLNGGVNVNWTVSNEVNIKAYTIERSTDGGRTYTTIGTQAAKNGTSVTDYTGFDAQPKPGNNLYRIRIESKDGAITYSGTTQVTIGEGSGSIQIAVYPNPVRKGKVHLQLTNLQPGAYLANVYSEGGQIIYQKKIIIGQSNTVQSEELTLGNTLAQGNYQLRLTDDNGNVIKDIKLMVGR